ncbi:amp-binding enzyme [Fusarium albosuccineum]|uniref:Amp-binding enzyme n=1 Tax=Fusarium albosuccineum TaxID=1237068 RepID=A0A8H4LA09_9HYPO|nr:amp-binding enzyme [Fusarium albosuccineum]
MILPDRKAQGNMFLPPSWVPEPVNDTPNSITIEELVNSDEHGRHPKKDSRPAYTCGHTGRSISAADVYDRTPPLATAIAAKLGLEVDGGLPLDKVIAIHAVNTVGESILLEEAPWTDHFPLPHCQIDYMLLIHAIHRLSGVATPASAACTASELQHQLKITKAKAIFACAPLLSVTQEAAEGLGVTRHLNPGGVRPG